MPVDSNQISEKYRTRVAQSGQAYRDGVTSPTRSWQQGYTNAIPKMVANLQRAVAENRPQSGAQAVGDAGWQQATLEKADRYAASADRAAQGYALVAPKIAQAAEAGRAAANAIGTETWEQRKQRMVANAEAIANTWGKPLR